MTASTPTRSSPDAGRRARRRRRRPPPPRPRRAGAGSPRPRPPRPAPATPPPAASRGRSPRPRASPRAVGEPARAALREEGADRLGGVRERRVVGGARPPGSSPPRPRAGARGDQRVADRLGEQVAELALGHRARARRGAAAGPPAPPPPGPSRARRPGGRCRGRSAGGRRSTSIATAVSRDPRARSSWSANVAEARGCERVAADGQHDRVATAATSSCTWTGDRTVRCSGTLAPSGPAGEDRYLPNRRWRPAAGPRRPGRATRLREEQAWRRSRE